MHRARARFAAIVLAALPLAACAAPAAEERAAEPAAALGRPVRLSFRALDGKPLTTASLAGRISLIGLLASYDIPSQAQAKMLASLGRRHTPRLNVAFVFLEPPENAPLVEAFVRAAGGGYPAAIADAPTIAGEGAFPDLHHVPSVVVLDPSGREAARHVGLATEERLEAIVRRVEQSSGVRE